MARARAAMVLTVIVSTLVLGGLVLVHPGGAVSDTGPDGPTLGNASASGAETDCRACHEYETHRFAESAMTGSVACLDCHDGDEPHNGASIKRTPDATDCAACHPGEAANFGDGKHALAEEAMNRVQEQGDRKIPDVAIGEGCNRCHKVGATEVSDLEDPNLSGARCDVCHSQHEFSPDEAAEPESCGTCHAGDHPHYDMWRQSRHGQLYQINESDAPGCVTCHMNENGTGFEHGVRTAWGFLGLRGEEPDEAWEADREEVRKIPTWLGPIHAPDVERESMSEWEAQREEMVRTCEQCHSESFVRGELERSDSVLRLTDNLTARAVPVLEMMEEKGAISEAEKIEMGRELLDHRFAAFMGSFHSSPEYTWDNGIIQLQADLMELRGTVESQQELAPLMENKATLTWVLEHRTPIILGLGALILVSLSALVLAIWTARQEL